MARGLPTSLPQPQVPDPYATAATPRADAQQTLAPIDIFVSGHEGYGDSHRDSRPYTPVAMLSNNRRVQRQYSYNRCAGQVDPRWPGELAQGYRLYQSSVTDQTEPPFFMTEWTDSAGNPLVLVLDNKRCVRIQPFPTRTVEITFPSTATGGAMHDDGSGIPYLYVALSDDFTIRRRNLAGTWTAAATVNGQKLLSLNNDLYITARPPAGPTGTAFCAVGKIGAGTDPASAAQPSMTVVGLPSTSINNLAAHGDGIAVMALKPEGIFAYDRALALWRPLGRIPYHEDNGKVFWYEDSDLCVALGSGGAVRVRGTQLVAWDLIPLHATPDVQTTTQVIAAATQVRNWGALVTQIGAKRGRSGGNRGVGSQVVDCLKTTDGVTYADYSTQVSDGDPTTVAPLGALPAANAWVLVGHPQPFYGVRLDLGAKNANVATLKAEYWAGAWTDGSVQDLTASGTGATLARDGWAVLATDPVAGGWVPTSFGGKSRYWLRLSVSAPLSASVDVTGIDLMPWRPGVPSAIGWALRDSQDRAGVRPHLLLSRLDEAGRHVVHDMGDLGGPDEIGAMLYAKAGGILANDDRRLVLLGKRVLTGIAMPPADRPQVEPWPLFGLNGLMEFSAIDLPAGSEVAAFVVEGNEWNGPSGELHYRFDDRGQAWSRAGAWTALPATIPLPPGQSGTICRVLVCWQGGPGGADEYATVRARVTRVQAVLRAGGVRHAAALGAQTQPVF